MRTRRPHSRPRRRLAGQALVEFSLVLIPFLLLLLGLVDLGRGIYTNNVVAEAAREIARVTSVHPCTNSPCTVYSAESTATIGTQKGMVPGLTDSGIVVDCVDMTDAAVTVPSGMACPAGKFVRAKVTVPFQVLTPLLGLGGTFTLSSTSHVQVP